MPKRIAKSIKIDSNLWKEVKHQVVEEEITISGWVEDALRKKLEKRNKEEK